MARVGFLGLGDMGTPMARRLLRAGHDLVVWNRSPERTVGLAQEGAAVAPSPAQAVVGADFIITMVATPEALEQVLFGTAGLAASLLPGQVVIDMSTVGPDEIRSCSLTHLFEAACPRPHRAASTSSWVRRTSTMSGCGQSSILLAQCGMREARDQEPP